MHFDDVISNLIPENSSIAYVGVPQHSLASRVITSVDINNITDEWISNISPETDYIVMAEVLELLDDPASLIKSVKKTAKNILVYEFKHYENSTVDPRYKTPWLTKGLENLLSWEFDLVRSIYLGYATVYVCEGPNFLTPEQLAGVAPLSRNENAN